MKNRSPTGATGLDRVAEILLAVLDRCDAEEAAERAERAEKRRAEVLRADVESDAPYDGDALKKKLDAVNGTPNGRRNPPAKRIAKAHDKMLSELGITDPLSCWACGQTPIERAHINARAFGGSDQPGNFFLLCAYHHDLQPDLAPARTQAEWLMETRECGFSRIPPSEWDPRAVGAQDRAEVSRLLDRSIAAARAAS